MKLRTELPEKIKDQLTLACYNDDYDKVKNILDICPDNIDLDFEYDRSKSGGNGTPLVLTGDKEIAKLLIAHGADVNYKYNIHDGITALDSAINTRDTKSGYRAGEEKYKQICDLIAYLESIGAKRGTEL